VHQALLCRRRASERFLQSFIIDECPIIVLVVKTLTGDEQRLVQMLEAEIASRRNKKVIVVHNFFEMKEVAQVQKRANYDLQMCLGAGFTEKHIGGGVNCSVYYRKLGASTIEHVIYAADGSAAGDHYNKTTLAYVRASIQNCFQFERANLYQRLCKYLNQELPRYLTIDYADEAHERTGLDFKVVARGDPEHYYIFSEPLYRAHTNLKELPSTQPTLLGSLPSGGSSSSNTLEPNPKRLCTAGRFVPFYQVTTTETEICITFDAAACRCDQFCLELRTNPERTRRTVLLQGERDIPPFP